MKTCTQQILQVGHEEHHGRVIERSVYHDMLSFGNVASSMDKSTPSIEFFSYSTVIFVKTFLVGEVHSFPFALFITQSYIYRFSFELYFKVSPRKKNIIAPRPLVCLSVQLPFLFL